MGENFPVNESNLSFSDDDANALFITQSSFSDVKTQDVEEAVNFLGGLGDVSFGEIEDKSVIDVTVLSQKSEEMCEKIFDFAEDEDNCWSVSIQENPIIVTRNSDGKTFAVGPDGTKNNVCQEYENNSVLPPISRELERDLKRFTTVVTAAELDESKNKGLV